MTLIVFKGFNIRIGICTLFLKREDGCGVVIALYHFVIECKKLISCTNVSASFG